MRVFSDLVKSFSTEKGGYSARKLSAFAAVMTAIFVTIKLLPTDVQIYALYSWLVFALLCLGLVTGSQLVMLKNGSTEKQPENNEIG